MLNELHMRLQIGWRYNKADGLVARVGYLVGLAKLRQGNENTGGMDVMRDALESINKRLRPQSQYR